MLVPEHENVKASKKEAGTFRGPLPARMGDEDAPPSFPGIPPALRRREQEGQEGGETKIPARGDGQGQCSRRG